MNVITTQEQLKELVKAYEKEDAFERTLELNEDYGAPEQEEKHNAHTIINKALEKLPIPKLNTKEFKLPF